MEAFTWQDVLEHPVCGRNRKPRCVGLNMIIDKGLGIYSFCDLLATAAPYIDFIKLGFGTSALYPAAIVREKIKMALRDNVIVYPGGTLFEIAVLQGSFNKYLQRVKELGCKYLEISDGTIELDGQVRNEAIRHAKEEGLGVITEVGKKDPDRQVYAIQLRDRLLTDLEAGADYVIVEGRESGTGVVMYDNFGEIKEEVFHTITDSLKEVDRVIWEAPQKQQQLKLINRLGNNVNLGNIQPGEILALEALRVGFRGDTLKKNI